MTGKNIFYLQITNPCIVRMRSVRENIAPNPLVQGLKHLASTDGASAWWFAKVDSLDYFDFFVTFPCQVLIANFSNGSAMGCTEDLIMAGFVLCVITLAIRFDQIMMRN